MRRSRFEEAVVALDLADRHLGADGAGSEQSHEAATTIQAVGEVLREWRAAERVLAELAPGSPEWTRALEEVELLRSRYQQVFSAAEAPSDAEATG